jgi:hypothetical protein
VTDRSKFDEVVTAALNGWMANFTDLETEDKFKLLDRCIKWSQLNRRHSKGKFGEGLDILEEDTDADTETGDDVTL